MATTQSWDIIVIGPITGDPFKEYDFVSWSTRLREVNLLPSGGSQQH
jgi:hypothetical protein